MSKAGYLLAGMGVSIADQMTRAYQENQRLRLQAGIEGQRENRADARYEKRSRQKIADQLSMRDVQSGRMVRAEDFQAPTEDIAAAHEAQRGHAPGARVPGPGGGMVSSARLPETRDVGLTPASTEWGGRDWVRPTERQRLSSRMGGILAEGREAGAREVGKRRYLEQAGFGRTGTQPMSLEEKLRTIERINTEIEVAKQVEPFIGQELKNDYTDGIRQFLPEYNASQRRRGLPELELVKKRPLFGVLGGPPQGVATTGAGSYWILQPVGGGAPGRAGEMRVRLKETGEMGTLPVNQFDPAIYEEVR